MDTGRCLRKDQVTYTQGNQNHRGFSLQKIKPHTQKLVRITETSHKKLHKPEGQSNTFQSRKDNTDT